MFYIIKQDIRIYIYVAYSRPNGWTDWAEICCGHLWVAGECYKPKKNFIFKKRFQGQRRALQLVDYKIVKYKLLLNSSNL